jgi:hypothetical protein
MRSLALVTSCVALLAASPLTQAAPTLTTDGGRTSVRLDPGFLSALKSLSVKPAAVAPATLVKYKSGVWARFGITTGAADLGTVKAEIAHEGGLSLTAGGVRVELTSFIIDLTDDLTDPAARPVLTGLVVAKDSVVGRLPLFDLDVSGAKIQNLRDYLRVTGVKLTLSSEAAAALNGVFGITALQAGLPVGVASVRSTLGEAH